ncbi:MAG: AAA family ATPase [Bacteroidota bacterium]
MSSKKELNYWLFQVNPANFRLAEALQVEALQTFQVRTHKKRIRLGDKVILWQTGKRAGCYALAEIKSEVGEWLLSEEERHFYRQIPEPGLRVQLKIEYNLWHKPITKDTLPHNKSFDQFYGGLSGTNYKATAAQYKELVALVEQSDLVHEPEVPYSLEKTIHYPLNLILYGPPGTGKTYHTINYALAILENRSLEELALEKRKELRKRFLEYSEEGYIHFVTFHQAFTYEDFVEGIKPVTQGKKVTYEIENGIFKHISLEAKREMVERLLETLPRQQLKIDFKALYKAFLKHLKRNSFKGFQTPSGTQLYLHRIERNGDLSIRREKSFRPSLVVKRHLKKLYLHFPELSVVKNLESEFHAVVKDINAREYWAVFRTLKEYEDIFAQSLLDEEEQEDIENEAIQEFDMHALSDLALHQSRKFVLIIDEINRGNIASIFGDLITLIDPDKRDGAAEALRLMLPYSKTLFCVPPNLHIVATMNSADRSVEAMDLALRRRFNFVEMRPRPELLKQSNALRAMGVDLSRMLGVINQRIELLLDKDYCIGHSYFMGLQSLADLQKVFAIEIIPLLQEYFFGNYSKIGLVLGKEFIVMQRKGQPIDFATFEHEFSTEWAEKTVYQIRPMEELDAQAFISIYQK